MIRATFTSFPTFLLLLHLITANVIGNDLIQNDVQSTQPNTETSGSGIRNLLSQLPGRRLGRLSKLNTRENIEALRQTLQSSPEIIEWQQFTPPPVTEPNCYVEVQVTQKMPGRCTKLGGRIPACQSQDVLTIDYSSCQ